ncbi:MAG: DUF4258 domain-containing protein [Gemmatimonadetes bacterium]|nr:DUF4258 domain-containing protein [Gemmatimonadota bacterium]
MKLYFADDPEEWLDWPVILRRCFDEDRVFYSRHARNEMRNEELGPISDGEVYEAIVSGDVIESYPEDQPYPSVLVLGQTKRSRPLHIVCAYARPDDRVIVVTVYQPDPERWAADFRRRKS